MTTPSARLPEHLARRFKTGTVDMKIGRKTFTFLEIENLDVILEEIVSPSSAPGGERPFWVKIWESSIILAHFLSTIEVDPDKRMLEIGAGMGVAGVVAAAFGHNVTITDNNEDALAFARVNASLNGLPDLPVVNVDWRSPLGLGAYDVIFGSDIVYAEASFGHLVNFLRKHLAAEGTMYIAVSGFIKGTAFFNQMSDHFSMQKKTYRMRSQTEEIPVHLYKMVLKSIAS